MKLSSLTLDVSLVVAALVAGPLLLPAVVYAVGGRMFGAYQGGLSQFYRNLWQDLLSFTPTAWILAFAPALCVLVLRLILRKPAQGSNVTTAL